MAPRIDDKPQVSIVLMGGTGTGKTTFANLVGHSNHLVGDGLESCTQHIQSHKFDFEDYGVTLIDVPGFDDTNKSDAEILNMIAEFLSAEYRAGRRLSGVIYVHRISDVRMGGASRRNFTMFKKLCGEDAFANVAIVTTRWDMEDKAVAEARLAELAARPQLFKSVLDGNAHIFRHDRGYDSAREILRHLVTKTPKPLLIQREMADGKAVTETAAGQELEHEILQQVEKHQREMTELIQEMARTRDASSLDALEEELQALREQVVHWQDEGAKLAGPAGRSESGQHTELSPELLIGGSAGVSAASAPLGRPSTDEHKLPGVEKTIEMKMGEISQDLRRIQNMVDENQQRLKEHVRLGNVERQLAGALKLPACLVVVVDRFLAVLRQAISSR